LRRCVHLIVKIPVESMGVTASADMMKLVVALTTFTDSLLDSTKLFTVLRRVTMI